MDRGKRSNYWEVLSVSSVSGGAGPGGGVFVFHFRRDQGAVAVFSCVTYGLGVGGAGGSVGGNYSRITTERSFSVDDLDGCAGRITSLGAAWGGGIGSCHISAFGLSVGNLFLSQQVGGVSFGAGAGGVVGLCRWDCTGTY